MEVSVLRYLQDKRQLLNFLAVLTPTVNLVHLKLFEVYCTHVILFLTVKYSGDQTFNLVILNIINN